MRIIRVEHGGTSYYGILEDGLVFRLHQQPGHMEPIPLSEAKVLPLVTPSKVVCVGLNYKAHAEELGYPLPNMPSFFLKPPSSIIGNGEPIVLPSGMGRIEHEAELAMVVGKVCRNLTPEEAEESLFGFTCANDVTAREVQKVDPLIGHCKSYDTFCPIGPWIETELEDINDLSIRCLVNGEVRQSANTGDMIFRPLDLLCFLSRVMTLMPGDVILTGTPPGISPIQADDVVQVSIEGIGTLSNPVEAPVLKRRFCSRCGEEKEEAWRGRGTFRVNGSPPPPRPPGPSIWPGPPLLQAPLPKIFDWRGGRAKEVPSGGKRKRGLAC